MQYSDCNYLHKYLAIRTNRITTIYHRADKSRSASSSPLPAGMAAASISILTSPYWLTSAAQHLLNI